MQELWKQPTSVRRAPAVSRLLQSDEEVAALDKLKKNFFDYMLSKSALKPDYVLFSYKDHIATKETKGTHTEPAVVVYLSIAC